MIRHHSINPNRPVLYSKKLIIIKRIVSFAFGVFQLILGLNLIFNKNFSVVPYGVFIVAFIIIDRFIDAYTSKP